MKILTIIGTRPQFIKMPLLSYQLNKNNITEIIIHTGQHFDDNMSKNIFDNLSIPQPHYNININGQSKTNSLGNMIFKIGEIISIEQPDYVMVYGDCDTTLAGALSANKMDIPIIHIESGLRSYDKSMPEEINRILVDNISTILFCPNENSVKNLEKENITKNVYQVGDLMIELLRNKKNNIINDRKIIDSLNLQIKKYYLLTIHRKSNTDINKLQYIFNELGKLDHNVIYPIHPRIKQLLDKLIIPDNIIIIAPINYIDMMILLYNSIKLITDSGGLQKEAYEFSIPCITLRENTEWIETVENGMNILVTDNIYENIINFNPKIGCQKIYEDNVAENIVKIIIDM